MAKSRRKAGGATSGRYKPKRMGKGWSSYRSKLGFRPPMVKKDTTETAAKMTAAQDPAPNTKEEGAEAQTAKTAPKPAPKTAAKKTAKKAAKKAAKKTEKPDGDAE